MTLNEMLLRLHRRLGISTGAQDELLTDLLADANALMLAYLNRAELPAALESIESHAFYNCSTTAWAWRVSARAARAA